jgi:ornithine carrier protein
MARLKSLFVTEGLRGLYRGFGVTLLRAIPSNAVIFGTYECVSKALCWS